MERKITQHQQFAVDHAKQVRIFFDKQSFSLDSIYSIENHDHQPLFLRPRELLLVHWVTRGHYIYIFIWCKSFIFTKKNIQSHTASGCDCRPCKRPNGSSQEIFDSIDFYLSRFARILPVYYFCIIVGAILIPFGHGPQSPENLWFNVGGSVMSLFLLQTWVLVFGFGPNGPSWTVSTLFFFYLVYPR